MQKKYITKSYEETIALGSKLGAGLSGGEFIALTGDLGGGKTQFTKGIASGLGITETVVSPTFTIERIYTSPRHSSEGWNPVLHHFDLYRTHNDRETAESIRDLRNDPEAITVIEWPENIEGILPETYLAIEFLYINENERKIVLTPMSSPTSQIKYDKLIGDLS